MDYSKIDIADVSIKDEPYHINKEVSFYNIRIDEEPLKITANNMKSTFGIKINTFEKKEINFVPNEDLKKFIKTFEDFIQKECEVLFHTESKEFKSCLKQYKEYDEFIKFNVDEKSTKYNHSIDFKNKECICVFTITGVYCNSKSYGLSFKLNKISLE